MASSTEQLDTCTAAVLEFLQSKCLFAAERALRTELELETSRGAESMLTRNLWTSKLEAVLGAEVPRPPDEPKAAEIRDLTPVEPLDATAMGSSLDPNEGELAAGACASAFEQPASKGASGSDKRPPRLRLFEIFACKPEESEKLRRQRGQTQGPTRVIFRDGVHMSAEESNDLAHVSLPLLYNPSVNGLEDSSELPLAVGVVIAQRYRVVAFIGKGSFSRVVQCLDLFNKKMVSVKVLRNDKDCLDQGLGEVRLLALIARNREQSEGDLPLLQLLDYFYYKEHLFIVTELLRDSLFNFYRYLNATQSLPQGALNAEGALNDSGAALYFKPGTLATLAFQLLEGLRFLHGLGITHCDLKPENVCIVSASKRQFKLIDFGSAVMRCDCHNSYVQSRWYRAPEVMLGLPWDGKVDVWGVGCILAELLVGQPIFHGGSVELVLAAHAAVLGPHPKHMLEASELSHMYFTKDGLIYSIEPGGERRAGVMRLLEGVSLQSLTKVEDAGLLRFLTSLLSIDPDQRPTAAEALEDPWLLEALSVSPDGQRHRLLAHLEGYHQSPVASRAGSLHNSASPSPDSSQNASPARERGRSKGGSSAERHSSTGTGPGVPEAFRDAVQSDASRSHEWRQKLVRLVAPLSKDNRSGAGSVSPSGSDGSPPLAPLSGTAGGAGWPTSFNLRSSNKVADSPPKTQGTGAPPLSLLHRPKMRL